MKIQSVTKDFIVSLLPPVCATSHKGTQGHTLLIGGSEGKVGSICMSTLASLRAGCGLATAFVPKCAYKIIQGYVPEAMALTDRKRKHISKIKHKLNVQAIAIGPGLGLHPDTQRAVLKFLFLNQIPLVIDADAINILSASPAGHMLKSGDILTPYRKELERLLGSWTTEEEMLTKAINFSLTHQVVIVAKGAPSIVIDGESVYENSTGNAGLATAGSGDVLTGILAGLRAQGLAPLHTALCGTYLHGLAADIGVTEIGTRSFIASDIIRFLGSAFLLLDQPKMEN
jgi:ADP-dependent NAD(P)H-hydrate dehydratase